MTTAVLVMTGGLVVAIAVAAWLLRIRSDSPATEAAEPGGAR